MASTAGLMVMAAFAQAQKPPPDVELPDLGVFSSAPEAGGVAQRPTEVSIIDVLNAAVYVTSKRPQLVRESPGVVTLVTREEIIGSGARDLIDVLMLVPGFHFGVDVQGVVSIGFRGNWGHEGKVLVLLDGHEMNELLYSTVQLGNHFPVEHIDRLEVIRGPGSAIYGGYAELAVINIVTRPASKLEGAATAASYGHMIGGDVSFGRRNLSLAVGKTSGRLSVALSGILGQGNRSGRTYADLAGETYSLADDARTDPRMVNAVVQWRDLRLRVLWDDYRTTSRDGFDDITISAKAFPTKFPALFGELTYDLRLRGDRATITPRLSYKRQRSWLVPDESSPFYYDKTAERILGGLSASIDVRKNLNFLIGAEGAFDRGTVNRPSTVGTGFQTSFTAQDGTAVNQISYRNLAAYSQLSLNHKIANLTVGARVENHSQFGTSFVPRVGLTKVMGRFHAKGLVAGAFRAPGLENLNINADITPEKTLVFELETGLQISSNAFVSANVFDITISDPIVYTAVGGVDGYFNSDQTGSRGGEVDFKMRYPRGYLNASGSLYTASGRNHVDLYAVPGSEHSNLAFPLMKLTASAGLKVYRELTVGPSAAFLTERYQRGVDTDGDGEGQLIKRKPVLLVNLFANYANLGVPGLEVGAGMFNILDADYDFIQPYNGGHPPLPGPSREVVARLAYTQGF